MFDEKRFMAAAFEARETDVPVPDMKDFFDEEENPAWRVRGLTGQELGLVHQAVARNRNMDAILEGLASAVDKEKSESIRKLIGDRDEVPDDIAKRLEMLTIASVAPECDLELAKKVARVYPIEFYQITNEINRLTGMGMETKKKPAASSKT